MQKTKGKASTYGHICDGAACTVCLCFFTLCRHMFVSIPLSIFMFVQVGTMLGDEGGKCNL